MSSQSRLMWKAERESWSLWPDLPPELLERILSVLAPVDRVAVRLVCPSWRACVRERFPSDPPFEVPRLLIRRPGQGGALVFFSLRHRKILPFALPSRIAGGRCCGHVGGWLAMAFDSDRSVVLYNLVSGRSVVDIPSPPVSPVAKMVFSGGPPTSTTSHDNGGWVAAVLGRTGSIAVLHSGHRQSDWMRIGVEEGGQHQGFVDMAFWRGGLCALAHDGAVLAFRDDLRAVSVLRDPERMSICSHFQLYLVPTEKGDLILVSRKYWSLANGDPRTAVEVRMLASPPEKRRWDVVAETPGHALFVGAVVSAAVPVALYDAAAPGSCVYFARRQVEMLAPHAICEYSMLDEQMKGVPVAGGHSVQVEPVWITPFV